MGGIQNNYYLRQMESQINQLEVNQRETLSVLKDCSLLANFSPLDQMSLISSYLDLGDKEERQYINEKMVKNNNKQYKQINSDIRDSRLRNYNEMNDEGYYSPPQKSNFIRQSCFHNFQKHLVITLRGIMKSHYSINPILNKISDQILNIFKKSHTSHKESLLILFGKIKNKNKSIQQLFKKYNYHHIFHQYQTQTIAQAQHYLRNYIVKQLQEINIQKYIEQKRRMTKKYQFIKYFTEFINTISNGPIAKRLPYKITHSLNQSFFQTQSM